jgi:hypothetical protein
MGQKTLVFFFKFATAFNQRKNGLLSEIMSRIVMSQKVCVALRDSLFGRAQLFGLNRCGVMVSWSRFCRTNSRAE